MEHPYFKLLVEEGPAEAFEQVLQEASARGDQEHDVRRLRSEMLLALQIRSVLQERKRREAELAALNETAVDLTSLRGLDQVLNAIVRRARNLLGTDTSYLTLLEHEANETRMRVTEGISTREIRELRIRLGAGLGGLVAETKRPVTTANYLCDERLRHDHPVDQAVAAEGLTAILGVPLMIDERVIGVLFAADREERVFSPNEIALLSSLGAHATVAIENARLFQELEEALEELNQANRIIQQHSQQVERATEAHERLTQLVLQSGQVDEVARAIDDLLPGDLLVIDSEGHVLAGSGVGEQKLNKVLDGVKDVGEGGRSTMMNLEGEGQHWVAPIVAGSDYLGALVLCGVDVVPASDLRMLERAAQITALLLLNQRAAALAEQRIRGELLGQVLTGNEKDIGDIAQRALMLGTDLYVPHSVVVAQQATAGLQRAASAASSLASQLGGIGGEHDGNLVFLLPDLAPREAAQFVWDGLSLTLGGKMTAAAAGTTTNPSHIPATYEEARRCLLVLLALDRQGSFATREELGVYGLLLGHLGSGELEEFICAVLAPVIEYDRNRGTELLETLQRFFDSGCNVAQTAARMHIHVNTMRQRIQRVDALLGEDWQQPHRALTVHLALRLRQLAQPL